MVFGFFQFWIPLLLINLGFWVWSFIVQLLPSGEIIISKSEVIEALTRGALVPEEQDVKIDRIIIENGSERRSVLVFS